MDLNSILAILAGLPTIGPIVVKVVSIVLGASAIITAVVACTHALVALLQAIAKIPGLSALQSIADSAKGLDDKFGGIVGKIMSVISQLSLLPLPAPKPQA